MSEFKVRIPSLNGAMDSVQMLESILQEAADSVMSVKRNLRVQIRQKERIDSRLTGYARTLESQRSAVGRAVRTGRQVAEFYEKTEDRLTQIIHPSSPFDKIPWKWRLGVPWGGFMPSNLHPMGPAHFLPTRLELIRAIANQMFYRLKPLYDFFTGAPVSGEISGSADIFGMTFTGTAKGDLLAGEIKGSSKAEWDIGKREAELSAKLKAKGHVAQGELSYDVGNFSHGSIQGEILAGYISGTIGATLFKNGKLDPSLEAKAGTGISGLSGKVEGRLGTEDFNTHAEAKGDLLTAKAEAGVSVSKDGVEAKAGAEAYLAKGEISGGLTLFGIKIDLSAEGKAGGAGVNAGGSAGPDSVSGEIGAGLGLGFGLKIKIDWSNAFWK